jgi:hemoglobin-like flavoprotein
VADHAVLRSERLDGLDWLFFQERRIECMNGRNDPAHKAKAETGLSAQGFTPMLTTTQKTLVQDSFATIAPIADDAAALFYRRLFELDPSLEAMFRGDMAQQRKKLMQMLTAAVKGLDRLDLLVPAVEVLGRRHAHYGVTDAHYETVGAALLWTLEKGLGPAFDAEMREAWTTVYGLLATTMKGAARTAMRAA